MDFKIKRLDHLGVIAGVMKDLKVAELIDDRLQPDVQVNVTPGEASVGMILNGLGFSNRVISLTPQFFETKPLSLLIRKGIDKSQLNRHKLGRTLDAIAQYGCEEFFNEIALSICVAEKIDLKKVQNDTTSFSVKGSYENQEEDAEVYVTHGYSKAKRPDLKQIVMELGVSSDGSVPFIMKPWSGNASDNKVFNARIKALKKAVTESYTGKILIADAKLYTEKNIRELASMHFITRVPSTIKHVSDHIKMSLKKDDCWITINKNYKFQSYFLEHYGTKMRWVVYYSQQAHDRAKKTFIKALQRKKVQLKKDLFHLQAQRFSCEKDARKALDRIAKKHLFHCLSEPTITPIKRHKKAGRPVSGVEKTIDSYQIAATFSIVQTAVDDEINRRSCFVLATNIPEKQLESKDVIREYKEQDHVEKGFQFIKSPKFFAEAFFIKSTTRLQALLVIMTLALLVYTVAQRRLRQSLKEREKTIPNQINQPIKRPTLRWIFQLLEGIYQVAVLATAGQTQKTIEGVTDLRKLILSCFGKMVMKIYGIDSTFYAPSQ